MQARSTSWRRAEDSFSGDVGRCTLETGCELENFKRRRCSRISSVVIRASIRTSSSGRYQRSGEAVACLEGPPKEVFFEQRHEPVTITRRLAHLGHDSRRATQKARSTSSSGGRGRSFFSAVTCCRRARFSITRSARRRWIFVYDDSILNRTSWESECGSSVRQYGIRMGRRQPGQELDKTRCDRLRIGAGLFQPGPFVTAADEQHSENEIRYYALGRTNTGRRLFISYTIRGESVRVISARDMTSPERKEYEHATAETLETDSEV